MVTSCGAGSRWQALVIPGSPSDRREEGHPCRPRPRRRAAQHGGRAPLLADLGEPARPAHAGSARILRRDACNANWFTIAQWAVLTVGRNLRGGDAPHRASALPQAVRRRLTPAVLNLRSADDRRVAAALSYGQVMVFASVYHALLQTEGSRGRPVTRRRPASGRVAVRREQRRRRGRRRRPGRCRRGLRGRRSPPSASKLRSSASDGAQDGAPVRTAARARRSTDAWIDEPDFYEQVLAALAAQAGHQERAPRRLRALRARHEPVDPEEPRMRTSAQWRTSSSRRTFGSPPIEQVILDDAVTLVIDHVPRHYHRAGGGSAGHVRRAEPARAAPHRPDQLESSGRRRGGGGHRSLGAGHDRSGHGRRLPGRDDPPRPRHPPTRLATTVLRPRPGGALVVGPAATSTCSTGRSGTGAARGPATGGGSTTA